MITNLLKREIWESCYIKNQKINFLRPFNILILIENWKQKGLKLIRKNNKGYK